jgi:hypothetical protein
VTEEALHLSDIDSVLKKMGSKTVAECMNRGVFDYPRFVYGYLYGILDCGIADMVSGYFSTARING